MKKAIMDRCDGLEVVIFPLSEACLAYGRIPPSLRVCFLHPPATTLIWSL
jgi:hypothetical protein